MIVTEDGQDNETECRELCSDDGAHHYLSLSDSQERIPIRGHQTAKK